MHERSGSSADVALRDWVQILASSGGGGTFEGHLGLTCFNTSGHLSVPQPSSVCFNRRMVLKGGRGGGAGGMGT